MEVLAKNEGLITQIIGPVIDVEFSNGNLPEIFDALEIYTEDDKIILRKANTGDIFTGSTDDLIEYHDKMVSKESIEECNQLLRNDPFLLCTISSAKT